MRLRSRSGLNKHFGRRFLTYLRSVWMYFNGTNYQVYTTLMTSSGLRVQRLRSQTTISESTLFQWRHTDQWWLEGGIRAGQHCAGGGIWRGKIWNFEILHPQLSVLFTVHTNATVVTIRISIGDLIAGVGRQQRRLAQAANTLAPPLIPINSTVCHLTPSSSPLDPFIL